LFYFYKYKYIIQFLPSQVLDEKIKLLKLSIINYLEDKTSVTCCHVTFLYAEPNMIEESP